MSPFIIETKDLNKSFGGFKAVDELNLQIRKGKIYGFLGPNGAGKSTTIRMLLGLMKPTSGEINIFGKDLRKNKMDILKKIGSIVESPSYYGNLTAYENLQVTAKLLDIDYKAIDEVLEIVRLTEWKSKQVKKFSLGMKQRLGIAQALISKPELLILDEPTNGLDPAGIHEIRELIKTLPEISDMTIIISSHILSEIELMADDIGIINRGKLLFQGKLEELHNRSKGEICIGTQNPSKTIEVLNSYGYKSRLDKNYVFVKSRGQKLEDLLKELVISDSKIFKFVEVEKNLEEIFMDFTEGRKVV